MTLKTQATSPQLNAVRTAAIFAFSLALLKGLAFIQTGSGGPACQIGRQLEASDALIVATPEYNGFPPVILKYALDWMARPDGDVAASPGALGGSRSLTITRQFPDNLGMLLMPEKL